MWAKSISLCSLLVSTSWAADLIVNTRTGSFLGSLNDTYPDVRQFKWVPYAKVRTFKTSHTRRPC